MNSFFVNLVLSLAVISIVMTSANGFDLFPGEEWETGFINVDPDKALFYYFFKCRNKTMENPPLLIWLEGGPSYTSAAGVYMHGGPYIVDNVTSEIVRNKDAWNNIADVLFIDQPAGTIFSYSNDLKKICENMTCVAEDLYIFILNFYHTHQQYRQRNLYISGTSYAGHFVPAFAKRIVQDGKSVIPFKGIITFNGFYDAFTQVEGNLLFLYVNKLISKTQYIVSRTAIALCRVVDFYNIPLLSMLCGQTDYLAYKALGVKNDPYNIELMPGPDVYEEKMKVYMNQPEVQKALGVNQTFTFYNWTVFGALLEENDEHMYPELSLEVQNGFKVYFVHGDVDYMCSYIGGIMVAENIEWEGQGEFIKQPFVDMEMNGVVLGKARRYKNLAFVIVHHTGHSIFYRQRAFGLEILKEFMNIS